MSKAKNGVLSARKIRNKVKAFIKKTLREHDQWIEPIPSMQYRLAQIEFILEIDGSGRPDIARMREIVKHIPPTKREEREKLWGGYKERSQAFYASREWQTVRYKVLLKANGECMACGRSKAVHGVVLHIDHVKPRYHFPALELEETNLQVLCADCNMGKGAWDQTDWR